MRAAPPPEGGRARSRTLVRFTGVPFPGFPLMFTVGRGPAPGGGPLYGGALVTELLEVLSLRVACSEPPAPCSHPGWLLPQLLHMRLAREHDCAAGPSPCVLASLTGQELLTFQSPQLFTGQSGDLQALCVLSRHRVPFTGFLFHIHPAELWSRSVRCVPSGAQVAEFQQVCAPVEPAPLKTEGSLSLDSPSAPRQAVPS